MRFRLWRRARSVETEYLKSLCILCDMFDRIAKATANDQNKYVQSMNEFQNSYQYEKFVTSMVKRMVTPLAVDNMRTWREAAKKSTRGKFLYGILEDELKQNIGVTINDQIIQNASLISTLPNDVAQKVTRDIADNALKGKRARAIEDVIRSETNKHSRASARLIARTEVSKTQSALTKARSEELGLRWYVWRTALDGNRVRKSHRIMEGVLVAWNDPPSPELLAGEKDVGNYHAGNIWNCRCYSEPLIEIDDVKWPHKVYYGGQIKSMGKREFEQIM